MCSYKNCWNTMPVFTTISVYSVNIVLIVLVSALNGDVLYNKETDKYLSSITLPPCQACKMLVDSFLKGMERTARNHFGGGDTAWEEEKLGSYATSEVRLAEIQERLCDENRARDQCLRLAEKWEEQLEEWWLKGQKDTPDLTQYLCIHMAKECCPAGHYGSNCDPCPGYPDRVCNNNGKCKGNGTRKGSGQCSCDVGYSGKLCDECTVGYYVSYKDDDKLLCSKCHQACQGACTQAGVKGCLACDKGWSMHSENGCQDVNECFDSPCEKNKFCVNSEGTYSCLACDTSCDGCSGDGPDMCEKCASGFFLKDNLCVDSTSQESYVDMTRYLTYLGLCVATCIIFQNSPMLASGVGLGVALYVTVSEYMLGTLPTNNFLSSVFQYFKS